MSRDGGLGDSSLILYYAIDYAKLYKYYTESY